MMVIEKEKKDEKKSEDDAHTSISAVNSEKRGKKPIQKTPSD